MKKRWRKAVTAKQTPWGEMRSPVVRCLVEEGEFGVLWFSVGPIQLAQVGHLLSGSPPVSHLFS